MAILRQQTNFVEQLYNSGMLDEQEQEQLLEFVEEKERKLQSKGAVWRAPRIVDVGPLNCPKLPPNCLPPALFPPSAHYMYIYIQYIYNIYTFFTVES